MWPGHGLTVTCPLVPEQYAEQLLQEETESQHIGSIGPLAPPAVLKPLRPLHRQVHLRGRPASKPTIIRGVTYYKAKDPEDDDTDEQRESGHSAYPEAGWVEPR